MNISSKINKIQSEINMLIGKATFRVVIKYGELSVSKMCDELDELQDSLPEHLKKYVNEAKELLHTFQIINDMRI